MERPADPQLVRSLATHGALISDLALGLREAVLEEAPEALESIYTAHGIEMWFGVRVAMKDVWFCYITAHTHHVNLGFPYGAALPDPGRVLQGTAKTSRFIRFASEQELARPFIRRFIHDAAQQVILVPDRPPRAKTRAKKSAVRRNSA
ncbi:MAG: DUF1801 domain-containing protein [Bryobacteraceae bacterium]